MNKSFLDALKEVDNYIYTENGAIAYRSTGNTVLDAFGSIAAMKDCSDKMILDTFYRAFIEDRALATKLLFYIRDIRGGQGMRRVFRVIARSLANTHSEYILNNLDNFLEYGRGDDLLCLLDTSIEDEVIKWMYTTLIHDTINAAKSENISLLAKWMPSENTSSMESRRLAKKIISKMRLTPKEYRKMIVNLRNRINIVESSMCAKDWNSIDYEAVPSKASMIYSNAFYRHSEDRYKKYIYDIASGKAKVNAQTLFPVDIIHKIGIWNYSDLSNKDKLLYDAMWKSLPDYFNGKDETGLCVVDTSGSMIGTPIEVAISLGIYCADKCNGPFKDHFITFSSKPRLQQIRGNDITNKVRGMINADWGMSTNIESVFDLILKTAISNNCTKDEIPSKLYVISDMQFNHATKSNNNETFMTSMRRKFAEAGYDLPALVYWNVRASDCGMFQQMVGGENCCMVSGYSPSLFKSVIGGTEYEEIKNTDGTIIKKQKLDPMHVMLNTLNSERYSKVWVA